jgi:beta propeller repeat protein
MKTASWTILSLVATIWVGCTSCNDNGADSDKDAGRDTGTETDTGTSSDADSDTDVDSDTDADTDSDSDSDSDSDTETADSGVDGGSDQCLPSTGALKWQPLPQGEDCGAGCRRLTFGDMRPEYAVDGDFVATERVVKNEGPYEKWLALIIDTKRDCTTEYQYFFEGQATQNSSIHLDPDVLEKKVVYSVGASIGANSKSGILLIDAVSGKTTMATEIESSTTAPAYLWKLSLSSESIAYAHRVGPRTDYIYSLKLFDRATGNTTEFASGIERVFDVGLSGDNVIWRDGTSIATVFLHDFKTGETKNISPLDTAQIQPNIDGKRVVWADNRESAIAPWDYMSVDHADIYLYDIDAGTETRLTDGAWIQKEPDIFGDIVVWQDHRNCDEPQNRYDFSNIDIWMHDLKTGKQQPVTTREGSQEAPLISGTNVVYYEFLPEEGHGALFLQDIWP